MGKTIKRAVAMASMAVAVGGALAVAAPTASAETEVETFTGSCTGKPTIVITSATNKVACVYKTGGAVSRSGIALINSINPTHVSVKTSKHVTFSTSNNCPTGREFALKGGKLAIIQIG